MNGFIINQIVILVIKIYKINNSSINSMSKAYNKYK